MIKKCVYIIDNKLTTHVFKRLQVINFIFFIYNTFLIKIYIYIYNVFYKYSRKFMFT